MASKGNGKLSNRQRVRLASMISTQSMKSIAEGYFELNEPTVKNLESENKDDAEAFNREVIKKWEYMNPCDNQVQVSVSDQFMILVFSKNKREKQLHTEQDFKLLYLKSSCE